MHKPNYVAATAYFFLVAGLIYYFHCESSLPEAKENPARASKVTQTQEPQTLKNRAPASAPHQMVQAPRALPVSEKIEMPEPPLSLAEIKASLDDETIKDLKKLVKINSQERDFLMKDVGLSEAEYRLIKERQLLLHNQLKQAALRRSANEWQADQMKQHLIRNHVAWMTKMIGAENYAYLQRMSIKQIAAQ